MDTFTLRRLPRPAPLTILAVSIALSTTAFELAAQNSASGSGDRTPTTRVVTLGQRYAGGSFKRFLFGSRYRDLWASPVAIEVLDLSTFAGGLTPIRPGGSGQTKGLHLLGGDGRTYVLRSVDKTLHVPVDFENTFFAELMQDLKIHAFHPTAALVVSPLMEATGILHADPKLVVLPDDPRLGEFREEYAGLIGMIEERPDEGPNETPGFGGSRKIVDTEALLDQLEESSNHRVDAREFLKARMLDMWLGDRDRHMGQWRWARFDDAGGYVWRPIPRDRDEPFVANGGLVWWVVQRWLPRFTGFNDDYPNIGGLTENGWDLDRILLGGLAHAVWDSVAHELQAELSDDVIAAAVRKMPPEYYQISGAAIDRALRLRRDHLTEAGDTYYRFISREVDLYATDQTDVAVADYVGDGMLDLSVTHRSGKTGALDAQPYLHRRFSDRETHEIRLYLRGAADELVARGSGTANITLRAIGGGGPDTLIDSTTSGRNVRFYDPRGENTFVTGPSTSVSTRRYERPRPSGVGPHEFYLDWGAAAFPAIVLGANADHGVVLGGGVVRYAYGFRRTPFKHRLAIRGGVSTTGRATFDYESYFAEVTPTMDMALRASVTGVAPTRFYGFGNDTPKQTPEFHRVDQYRVVVDPSFVFFSQSRFSFSFGPVFKFTDTQAVPGRLVQDSVYGAGQFSQFGAGAALDWRPVGRTHLRSRDVFGQTTWSSGFQFTVHASTFPAILDVATVFGTVSGDIRAHVTAPIPTYPTLSLRASGSKVWGEDEVPYHEAAYLGGGGSLRGFSAYRFAGDAALSGSAELRLAFGEFYFLVPVQFGVLGVIDVGRVYVDGASPGGWHSAAGGGVWFGPLRGAQTINISVAGGEQVTVHVYMGFGV